VEIRGVAVCFGQESPVFLHTAKKIFILAGLGEFFITRNRTGHALEQPVQWNVARRNPTPTTRSRGGASTWRGLAQNLRQS
jgi:hypothetical protein